jgi:four helix bundle protein
MDDDGTGNRKRETGDGKREMRVGGDVAGRLLNLAVDAIRLASRLPKDTAGRHVASQLVRCATGGGANYEEARAAESRNDFIHKVRIAMKEVQETVFWLALIQRAGWAASDIDGLIRHAREAAGILGASAQTARRNAR